MYQADKSLYNRISEKFPILKKIGGVATSFDHFAVGVSAFVIYKSIMFITKQKIAIKLNRLINNNTRHTTPILLIHLCLQKNHAAKQLIMQSNRIPQKDL